MATELEFLGRDGTEQLVATVKSLINGGGSTAPDWDAAEGEPGHVLNRTHYEAKGMKPLLFESQASVYSHPTMGQVWEILYAPSLKIGSTYRVVYNGTSYNCECKAAPAGLSEDPNAVAMGNFSVVGGENTGEPFAMMVSALFNRVDVIDLVGSTSVIVGIFGDVIRKLDSKFLPDGLPYAEFKGWGAEILPECQPLFNEIEATFSIMGTVCDIVVGKTYIVNWNGTEYSCVAQDASMLVDGAIVLGNVRVLGISNFAESDAPFMIAYVVSVVEDNNDDYLLQFVPLDGTTELTVSIKEAVEIVHKLDPKCLPDGVPYSGVAEILAEGEATLTSEVGTNNDTWLLPRNLVLSVGETYIVVWGGVEYEVVGQDISSMYGDGAVGLGELSDVGYVSNNEPFVVLWNIDLGTSSSVFSGYAIAVDHSAVPSLSIKHVNSETIRKLDAVCLPDIAATKEYVDETISERMIPSPANAVAGDLLTFDGTNWVRISKADLIAEIIAALPRAEEASF